MNYLMPQHNLHISKEQMANHATFSDEFSKNAKKKQSSGFQQNTCGATKGKECGHGDESAHKYYLV